MLTSWIVTGMVASALTGSPSIELAAVAPPPAGSVAVEVATANGSGCPDGTATATLASDNSSITISYDSYTALTGPGVDATEQRKNCQISLRVAVPAGYRYSISRAEHQGFARLESNATGLQRTAYYFAGLTPTASATFELDGPFNGRYEADEAFGAPLSSPCTRQRNLNINNEVRVIASENTSEANLVSQGNGNRSRSTYRLAWNTCG